MHTELKNQTLVAAEVARQNGFEGTHLALLEVLHQLYQEELSRGQSTEIQQAGCFCQVQ